MDSLGIFCANQISTLYVFIHNRMKGEVGSVKLV